jgi:WS/DGAT/MGAT family acyltransferase
MPDLAPFRRRLAAIPFGFDFPVWIDDPDLCIRSHVHRLGAPAPGSDQVLAGLVAQIASQPLDRQRPLWELWVIEGLAEGRVALVFKIHHAVADGVSAIQLLLQLLDPSPEGPEACGSHERVRSDPAPTGRALLAHALSRLPQRSARFARLLLDSTKSVAGATRSMVGGAADRARMPVPFSGPRTPWNGATSPQRTVAYGRAPLADVKLINSVFGTTVNHVVLAACTRTLRNYLEAHGAVPDSPLVAAIPVSLRSSEELGTYGNRISALLVHLPVHLADPVEQLLALRHDAAASKQHHTRLGVGALGEWAEFTSSGLLGIAARFYSDRKLAGRHRPLHNLVTTLRRGGTADRRLSARAADGRSGHEHHGRELRGLDRLRNHRVRAIRASRGRHRTRVRRGGGRPLQDRSREIGDPVGGPRGSDVGSRFAVRAGNLGS